MTWLPELIFERENATPMEPTNMTKAIHKGYITLADMSRYVVEYIKNDKLGPIANAHLAQADRCGIFSETCTEIAQVHAKAVDFAKTGYSICQS